MGGPAFKLAKIWAARHALITKVLNGNNEAWLLIWLYF